MDSIMVKRSITKEWWDGDVTPQQLANAFSSRVKSDGGIYEGNTCLVDQIQLLKSLGFYNKASLILTPNGYKESKLYSLKPASGAGDFAFTRSSTATRKGSSVIAPVPYNILPSSQTMITGWSAAAGTLTQNDTVAPDGSMSGVRYTEGITTTQQGIYLSSGYVYGLGDYTLSVYAKAGTTGFFSLCFGNSESNGSAKFNLNTGVKIAELNCTGSIVSEGNGWYRLSITRIMPAANNFPEWWTEQDGTTTITRVTTGTSKTCYVWGFQLETGVVLSPLFRTTDKFNVPRLDYTGTSCPSISLEPQRTNLFLWSRQFDNAAWVKTFTTVTANNTTSVDGLSVADAILETVDNSTHLVQQSISKAASSLQYTFSVDVKYLGRQWVSLQAQSGSNAIRAWYDVQNGVVGSTAVVGTGWTVQSSTLEAAPNGFYRLKLTVTSDATTTILCSVFSRLSDTDVTPFVGDITKGFYIDNAQLEQAGYASSRIETTSATVTRIADAITPLTGASALIGQTEGTIYFKGSLRSDSGEKGIISVSDGTTNNRVALYYNSSNQVAAIVVSGGVIQANIVTAYTPGQVHELTLVYSNNYVALFKDGVKIAQDITAIIPACSRIGFDTGAGTGPLNGAPEIAALAKTLLSDADAISLTTP